MVSTKYEKLLNKMRKQESYINMITNSQEWSDDSENLSNTSITDKWTHKTFKKSSSLSVFTPDDFKNLTEAAKSIKLKYRQTQKMHLSIPKLYLSYVGEQSCLNRSENLRIPIKFSDIHKLLLNVLSGNRTPYKPEWCTLLRRDRVPRVVLVVVEGIGTSELLQLSQNSSTCNSLKRKKNYEIISETFNDSTLSCEEPPAKKKLKSSTTSQMENKVEQKGEKLKSLTTSQMENKVEQKGEKEETEYNGINKEDNFEKWQPPNWFKELFPSCWELFGIHLEIFQSANPLAELYTTPVSNQYLNKINEENKSRFTHSFATLQNQLSEEIDESIQTLFTEDKFDRRQLLMSAESMIKFKFPMKVEGCPGFNNRNFANSKMEYKKVTKNSPLFGVDCEMCLTKEGNELTSVSIVDENSKMVYTTLVKPKNAILNYLTVYSGITRDMLKLVSTSVKDVQHHISKILPGDAILVGHSLNLDLIALKLFHPYVIDTSLIYNLSGHRQIRPSLKLCCKLFLNKVIQKVGKCGHDPTEDAAASLQLAKLKLSRDIDFGDIARCKELPFTEDQYNTTYSQIKKEKSKIPTEWWCKEFNRNLFSMTTSEKLSSVLVTDSCGSIYKSLLETSPSTTFNNESKSFKELVKISSLPEYQMPFTVLHHKVESVTDGTDEAANIEKVKNSLRDLDKRLKRLHNQLDEYSFIATVFTGSPKSVPLEKRSNGIFLLDIKGQDRKNFYSFRKL